MSIMDEDHWRKKNQAYTAQLFKKDFIMQVVDQTDKRSEAAEAAEQKQIIAAGFVRTEPYQTHLNNLKVWLRPH